MKILSILWLSLVSSLVVSAQEVKHNLYKGTIHNRPVTLYLKQELNPCGGETGFLYQAIYQYATGKNWIELAVSDNGKGNFCLTEFQFTGVMVLKKKENGFEGIWVSPDGKTQLKVVLTKQTLTAKRQAELEEYLEKTHYGNNDC